jgi:hypothetical protein
MPSITNTGSTTTTAPGAVSLPGQPVPAPTTTSTATPATTPAASTTTTAQAVQAAQGAPSENEQKVQELFAQMMGERFKAGLGKMQESFNSTQEQRQKEAGDLLKRASEIGRESDS